MTTSPGSTPRRRSPAANRRASRWTSSNVPRYGSVSDQNRTSRWPFRAEEVVEERTERDVGPEALGAVARLQFGARGAERDVEHGGSLGIGERVSGTSRTGNRS